MPDLSQFMTAHHRHCDDAFASAEQAVADEDWALAASAHACLRDELEGHLQAEEDVLFPRLQDLGPVPVMLMEHAQMRDQLAAMAAALHARDADRYAGEAETLLILMQQHNMKEEQILYPLAEDVLGAEVGAVQAALAQRLAPGA